MEGCPRLSAISFGLKLSVETVNLCEKIPKYITANYQEDGENFTSECEQMNRLRQNAINCLIDENGVQNLKQYYCQLQLLRNRFPMLPDTDCAVRFTWEDGFQREDGSYYDIRFEEACILYNIGSLYSKLGAGELRRTHESMKNACTYFRYAAACYEKIRDQYTPYSVDFTADILTCQVDTLLAQAHEAVLEKSLLDQRPPSVNAHIAMQISEYCHLALINLSKPGISSIVSKKFKEWRVALTFKLSYYLSIACYCSGLIAEESKKRGESVCYFENAVERLKEGWKNAEKISSDRTAIYKDAYTLPMISSRENRYKSVKRDNDSVYFEKVPALSSLPAIQGVIVAKPQAFDCHNPDVSGPDVFQKLVPLDIHLAASEYSEEKAKLLREIIELTETKNPELETFMNCLQLDRIPLTNEYLRLPRELLDCCAAATNRPTMAKELITSMQQLNSHHHDVTEQITDLEQLLETYQETNDSIKPNNEFKDLQTQVKTLREMMLQANDSNLELHRHMSTIIEHLKLLNSPIDQLEKSLPILTELDDEVNKSKFARLRLLMEKITTMKKQRETLLNDFRQKIQDDDITKLVLMRRQENHKNLFSDQIKKHEELINIIKQNCLAQEKLVQSLTEANADIADIRTKLITTLETRQRGTQEYINSFKAVDDTLSKANEGIEFYKKQSIRLKSLNDHLTTLQSQQPKLPLNNQRSTQYNVSNQDKDIPMIPNRPRLKDYLATMKPETWGSTTSRSAARIEDNRIASAPVSNVSSNNNNFYTNTNLPSGPLYSNMAGQNFTSLPNFNPYHLQSPIHPEPLSFPVQHAMPYQQPIYNQNFTGSSQMMYNPSTTSSFPQQQFYPTQSFQPPQSVYSQVPSVQHQIPPSQPIPTYHSGLSHPSMNPSQNFSDQNRPIQPFMPTKFDPYRPQPVGAYDIPNTQQMTIPTQLMNPQDIYRSGGLPGMNPTRTLPPPPSSSFNNNNYDPNQFVQYVPSSSGAVSASFANLSVNSMLTH